ncbi:hypothetical protein TI05_03250 [Achromatium sp. WMS3]|nr:hypothetical protein TI05_03250 [Achromatium sp. WMS3]
MPKDEKSEADDIWQHGQEGRIHYFVHKPTWRCGIHIRGLADLVGINERVIRSALKNTEKKEGDLRQNYETELYKILKNREIFLVDLRQNSPRLNGKEVHVILAEICFDIAHYYSGKGYKEAHQTVGEMGRLGAPQFVFIKSGFNPHTNKIVLDEIEYLIAKQEIQVTKSRTGMMWMYTNPNTGECGIGLKSITHICGGVALKQVVTYIEKHQDHDRAFIRTGADAIVRSNVAYDTIYYFGHNASPRKTRAKEWAAKLQQIDTYIHQQTGYAETNRESKDDLIAAQQREIERLRKQLGLYNTTGLVRWHFLLGTTLDYKFGGSGAVVKSEIETTATRQLLDFAIGNLKHYAKHHRVLDGLNPNADHNIVTYKSHHETLDVNAINEHIGYYVGYKKGIEKLTDKDHSQDSYHLVAVCTRYPEILAQQAGSKWSKLQDGLYRLDLLIKIIVVVTSQVEIAPHNSSWLLFSHDKERVEYALALPENADIPEYVPRLLREELQMQES